MTYSFEDVKATLSGPGGSVSVGSGAANAEEGISVEFIEDKDRLITGADGTPMHSLNPSKSARIIVRLLKTSPVNALLAQLYNFQITSSLFHGQNVFVLTNMASGDDYTASEVAFAKFPNNTFAKEAGIIEWELLAGYCDPILGTGLLAAA